MSNFINDDILKAWHRLLQEIELARNHHLASMLGVFSEAFPNPVLDYLLPSLLYLKLVALLDAALVFYIDHHRLTVPRKYRKDLHGRIDFLNDRELISDYSSLHKIRGLRNLLAHQVSEMTDWEKLSIDLGIVENEFQKLGFVGDRPKYEYFGERSAMRECDEPGVAYAQDFRYGIKSNDRITIEICITRKMHNSDN